MAAPAEPGNESKEEIVGEVPVSGRLALGTERLKLYLTNQRLIFARLGKRGTGALATSSLLGKLGGALEDLLQGGKESFKKKRTPASSPQEILDADKDNFPLTYSDVVRIELDPLGGLVGIMVLTKDDKLEFVTPMDFEKLLSIFQGVLPGKVSVRRTL